MLTFSSLPSFDDLYQLVENEYWSDAGQYLVVSALLALLPSEVTDTDLYEDLYRCPYFAHGYVMAELEYAQGA